MFDCNAFCDNARAWAFCGRFCMGGCDGLVWDMLD